MKKIIIFLLTILMIAVSILSAESDEWGAWFKTSMEMSKENPIIPEDRSINLERWKEGKNRLINNYKKYLKRNDNRKNDTKTDLEKRRDIVFSYYYDKTETELEAIVNFFIYVIENEKNQGIILGATKNLTTIAFEGNTKAENYISTQADNSSLSHRIRLQFNLSNITIKDENQSLNYLMNLIKKDQNVETTDLKFKSSDEGTILWYLLRSFFGQRYLKNLDYEYTLPLMKQMLFSRSKSVQDLASMEYLSLTNKTEMRIIYNVCWAKVQDKNTHRKEYINALYGLQALYELRDIGKHAMRFKGILIYFETLILKTPTKDGLIYVDSGKETRLSKEEKIYFQKRLRSK